MGRRKGSGKGVLASKRHHIRWLNHVREKLSPDNLKDVMQSPFRHLFEIPQDFQFQGQLYVIMSRRVRSSSLDRWCLEIEIGNFIVEFGPADFALMTGLKMDGSIAAPTESIFHTEVFRGRKQLLLSDIKKKFYEECNRDNNSLVARKLAYIYIAYGVVLMDGRPSTRLQLGFMHLIDDLESFKNFPWGRAAYQLLVARTHSAKKHIVEIDQNGKQRRCEAQGFVYALQAWAYEIFPELASYCADKNQEPVSNCARILRWVPHKRAGFDDLYPFFLTGSTYNPVKIQLDENEQQFLEALGVDASMKVAKPHPIERVTRQKKRDIEAEAGVSPRRSSKRLKGKVNSANSAAEEDDSNHAFAKGDGGIAELKEAIEKGFNSVRQDLMAVVSRMKTLEVKVDFVHDYISLQKKSSKFHEESKDSSATESEDREDVDSVPIEESKPASSNDMILIMKDMRPASSDPLRVVNPPDNRSSSLDRVVQLAIEGMPGYVVEPPSLEDRQPDKEYDVNCVNWSEGYFKPFNSWKVTEKDKKKSGRLELLHVPGDMQQWADVDWFCTLCSARGWLENFMNIFLSISTLINLVAYNYDREESTMQRDWAVLDMAGVNRLLLDDFIAHGCVPYVCGDMPSLCGLNWERASHMYGVGNVGKDHWVLFKVSFLQQQVTVYDSLSTSRATISGYFKNLCRNIPHVMRSKQLWDKMPIDSPLRDEWDIVICPNTPKQANLHDCGILAMKYMECLVRGLNLDKIKPKRCYIYRKSYCAQLYAWASETSGRWQ